MNQRLEMIKMMSLTVISFCLIAVSCFPAIASCSGDIAAYDHYIEFPTQNDLELTYHRQIAEALVKLHIGDDARSKEILAHLKGAANNEIDYNSSERAIYQRLVSLSDTHEDVCPRELTDLIKSILAQIRAEPKGPLSRFKRFLKNYGREKLELCGRRIRSMNKLLPGNRIAQVLDRFFTKVLALPIKHPKDRELALHLEFADMSNMSMDVAAMLRFVQGKGSRHAPMTSLRNFLDKSCLRLKAKLGPTLDVINLAHALGSKAYHRSKLMKLNFYNRLCLSWRRPETRKKIEANIISQAGNKVDIMKPRAHPGPALEPIQEEDESAESD